MKFLHMGDVHLGAEPENGTGLGQVRRAEIWETFREIIELCEREQIDLLLLAGDLFHGQPLLREVKEVDHLFRSLTHTRVVMIAGNHDCLLPSSHYYDVTFPEHVTFLMDTKADSVYLPELNTEVFGLSYETRQISEARYDLSSINEPERINILLAHGNIMCSDKSIPIHRSAIEAAGFDYAALGHIHNRPEISERIAYCGSLEPLNCGETGPKGYIVGELFKKEKRPADIHWQFVPCARREYVPLELQVTRATTELSLCEEMLEKMQQYGMQHLYLVTLVGTRAQEVVWNREALRSVVKNRGGNLIELRDETLPDFRIERLREEHQDTLVGRFIEKMETIEDEKLKGLALQYGLQALLARDEK